MYVNGRGAPKDEQQAAYWCRKAADQGFANTQHNLGFMYENGRGVPKDEQLAVSWYRKAADQGHAGAQNNIGSMFWFGRGVPKDEQQAYFWWLLGSGSGNAKAKRSRDLIEQQLSPAQRSAAQIAARNWKPVAGGSP